MRVTLISSSQKSKSGVYGAEAEFLPARYQGQDTTTPVRGIYVGVLGDRGHICRLQLKAF